MKTCVFCQAVRGEVPVAKVWEDEQLLAFLDHRPVFPGHVLLIPKRHLVTLDELLPDEVPPLFNELRILSRSVPQALGAQGSFVANNNVVSQSVPHLHWHIVPRRKGDGLKGFFWPRHPYRDETHEQEVKLQIADVHAREQVLDFWFGPGETATPLQTRLWFAADPEFDETIRRRFGPLLQRALSGQLEHWAETPRGRLALVLILDQFTRNLHRHTAQAFAGDEAAQRLVLAGLAKGDDRHLSLDQRVFFYLPLEHGEAPSWQEKSLEQFGALLEEAPSGQKSRYANFLDYAERHARIIQRFGRYPHRNEALGRQSTEEEREFLEEPDSSFW